MDIEEAVARISADEPGPVERVALMDRYADGSCLVFAFAVHWMTGFPVEALSSGGRAAFAHFTAIGPDGDVWDAQGPRPRDECAAHYVDRARWTKVDVRKFVGTDPSLDEAAIDDAVVAALRLLGPNLAGHVRRLPDGLLDGGAPRMG